MVYLLETPKSFYFRMGVPCDLREVLKKREIKKSLKTLNRLRAEKRAIRYAAQWHEVFDTLREPKLNHPLFSRVELSGLKKPADGSVEIASLKTDPRFPAAEKEMLDLIFQRLGITSEAFASSAPDNNTAAPVLPVSSPTPLTDNSSTDLLDNSPVPRVTSAQGITLSTAAVMYIKEKTSLRPSAEHHYKTEVREDFNLLIRILGDKPAAELNRIDAIKLFNVVKMLPANINGINRYLGKSIDEILELNDTPRAESTINGVMVNASALCTWMVEHEYVTQDFFKKLRVPRKKGGRDRFDDGELLSIFSHETFTRLYYQYDYHYFIPLIALMSGMRMNEICQIRYQDIIHENGIPVMHIVSDDGGTKVKTSASIRRVPVHPKLIELGFLEFAQTRKSKECLFDGLPMASDGRRSKNASTWFIRFRRWIKLTEKGKDFHSFRHTVIDDLKQRPMEINERVLKAVVGHSDLLSEEIQKDDITFDRYGKQYHAKTLHQLICMLDYSRVLQAVKPWSKTRPTYFSRMGPPKGAPRVGGRQAKKKPIADSTPLVAPSDGVEAPVKIAQTDSSAVTPAATPKSILRKRAEL